MAQEIKSVIGQDSTGGSGSNATPTEAYQEASGWEKIGNTLEDLIDRVIEGATSTLEGFIDSSLTNWATIAGLFSQDAQNYMVENWIAPDFLPTNKEARAQGAFDKSWASNTEAGKIVGDVAQGVGGMLPDIAISMIGGAPVSMGGLGANGANLALAALGVHAFGQAESEALNEGATFQQAKMAGAASAATEMLTERMFGGTTENIYGKGVFDKAVRQSVPATGASALGQTARRVGREILEEGAEEVVSEAVSPLIKSTYKGVDALKEYTTPEFYAQVAKAGLVGSLTALAHSGTVGYGMSKVSANGQKLNYVGKEANIQEAIEAIEDNKERIMKMDEHGKLDAEKAKTLASNVEGYYRNIENNLTSMSEKKRASAIEEFSLNEAFGTDGKITENFAKQLANDSALSGDTESSKVKYKSANRSDEVVTKVAESLDAKPATDLTDAEADGLATFKKAFSTLRTASKNNLGYVVVEGLGQNGAYSPFTRTIVLDKSVLAKDPLKALSEAYSAVIVHEGFHFADKTYSGRQLVNMLGSSEAAIDVMKDMYARGYFTDAEDAEVIKKYLENENATAEEMLKAVATMGDKKYIEEYRAILVEKALGNEEFIKRLIQDKPKAAERILNLINFDYLPFKTKRGRLQKAERLYLNAIEEAGMRYENKKIVGTANDDKDKTWYSLKPVDPVKSNGGWKPSHTTEEVRAMYPNLWSVDAEESEEANPTQIAGTLSTYNKIFDILKEERFDGTILDASSGKGLGTQSGRENYGFKVDDIEPYPSKDYKPKYKDYSRLFKKYDAIISNAVLNVIPQEQRDALVVKMGELLKNGGKMYINVRGSDVFNASTAKTIDKDNKEVYISDTGSYQKGFTRPELRAYLRDALGEGYTIKNADWNDNAVEVMKNIAKDDIKYSRKPLPENIDALAKENFGTTTNWNETGYLLKDGTQLDFSGRHWGGSERNVRHVDHADIKEILDGYDGYKQAQIAYVNDGNIRIVPENAGINLSVKPTDAQYEKLKSYINRFRREGFMVDYDDERGYTIYSKEYDAYTDADKIINDIKDYFENGVREQSEVARFHSSDILYSRKAEENLAKIERRIEDGNLLGTEKRQIDKNDLENIKRIFTQRRKSTDAERESYGKIVNLLHGYTSQNIKFGDTDSVVSADIVNDDFFTEEMLATSEANNNIGYKTLFFLDAISIDDEWYPRVEGLADTDSKMAYVCANSVSANGNDYDSVTTRDIKQKEIAKFEPNELNPVYTARHERFHLLVRDRKIEFKNPKGAAYDLLEYVCADNKSWTKVFDQINYWFQGHLTAEDYNFDDYAEEIACDLYSGVLKVNDEEIQGRVNYYVEMIDNAIEGARDKDTGLRYSRRADPTGKDIQTSANNIHARVFTRKEVSDFLNALYSAENEALWDGTHAAIFPTSTAKESVIDAMWKRFNTATTDAKRLEYAQDIAEYMVEEQVLMTLIDKTGDSAVATRAMVLFQLAHTLDANGVKDSAARMRFGTSTDKVAYSLEELKDYIDEYGLKIEATTMAEAVVEINKMYEDAIRAVHKQATSLVKSMNEAELNALKKGLTGEILKFAQEGGTASDAQTALDAANNRLDTQREQAKEKLDKTIEEERAKRARLDARWRERFDKYFDFSSKYINELRNTLRENRRMEVASDKWSRLMRQKSTKNMLTIFNAREKASATTDEQKTAIGRLMDGVKQLMADLNTKPKLHDDNALSIMKQAFSNIHYWFTNTDMTNYLAESDHQGVLDEITSKFNQINQSQILDAETVRNAYDIMAFIDHIATHANEVWIEGRYKPIRDMMPSYVKKTRKARRNGGWVARLIMNRNNWYSRSFLRPASLFRAIDGYEKNGFFQDMLAQFQNASIQTQAMLIDFLNPFDDYFEKNKKWFEELNGRYVKINGRFVPADIAIGYYCTLHRKQSWLHFLVSGWDFYNKGKVTIVPSRYTKKRVYEMTDEQRANAIEQLKEEVRSQLNETDLGFVKLIQAFMKLAGKAKADTDKKRYGFTNVLDEDGDYYYPVTKSQTDATPEAYNKILSSVRDFSFNKDVVKGASNRISILPSTEVVNNHADGMAHYVNMFMAVDNYFKFLNQNVSIEANKRQTYKELLDEYYKEFMDKYMNQYLKDIQGIGKQMSEVASWLRGMFATWQLAGNPKVLLTQLSSLLASQMILNPNDIIKGFGIGLAKGGGEDLDKHSLLARIRYEVNDVALAQANIERLKLNTRHGKVFNMTKKASDAMMSAIGRMDRLVIRILWGACQVKAEKTYNLAIGTEENKNEAAKLLQQVILETQQNALTTERSGAMRSNSEFMRGLPMFKADVITLTSKVIDGMGYLAHTISAVKNAENEVELAEAKAERNQAVKNLCRVCSVFVSIAAFLTALNKAFRNFYGKDDDDEEKETKHIIASFFGYMLDGFPLVAEAYDYFMNGFEVGGQQYELINDVLKNGKDLYTSFAEVVTGEGDASSVAKMARSILYTMGQVCGIPFKNLYSFANGVIRNINEEAGYAMDNLFKQMPLSTDLAKAIEAGDNDKAEMIAGMMTKQKVEGLTRDTQAEYTRLASKGYDVLPRTAGDSVTYNGEEYKLRLADRKAFKTIQAQGNKAVSDMLRTKEYKNASDEVKAKAVKWLNNVYYNLALEDLIGVEIEEKTALFAKAVDVSKLAIILAQASTIKADTDKDGKTITGSRKKKIVAMLEKQTLSAAQKYMILGYLGYANTNGEEKVRQYIQSLKMSKKAKQTLFNYCGYST